MGLADGLFAALRAWDARLARQTEATFNARTGRLSGARSAGVQEVALADAPSALRPRGRLLLEHHAVLTGSVTDLPVLRQLADAHDLDVLLVLWDAARGASLSVAQVEAWLLSHHVGLTTLLLRGPASSAPTGLGPADGVLPHTRLVDADGGVLRVWRGPLAVGEARAVIGAIAKQAPGGPAGAAPPRRRG